MNWVDFSKEHPEVNRQVIVFFKTRTLMHCVFTGIQSAREFATMDKIKTEYITHWIYVDQLGLPKSDFEKLMEYTKASRDKIRSDNGFVTTDIRGHPSFDCYIAIAIMINEIEKLKNK